MAKKVVVCESCGEKPAEYVLDTRNLCVDCYRREENRIRQEEPAVVT